MDTIKLTRPEIQSATSRVREAELLIAQLPETHDGRNTWLLNYGTGPEAKDLRSRKGIAFDEETQAAETVKRGGRLERRSVVSRDPVNLPV